MLNPCIYDLPMYKTKVGNTTEIGRHHLNGINWKIVFGIWLLVHEFLMDHPSIASELLNHCD